MVLKIDRGTKNKTVTGFVRNPFVLASLSAGVAFIVSVVVLFALPFSGKFSVVWPASGIALASLNYSKRKAFVYSIIAHSLALILARGLITGLWVNNTFVSILEMINVTAIVMVLRNLSVNRFIFSSVKKVSAFLTASALMSIFTGIFSMFLPPFRWENQVGMEWGIWAFSVIPSYWIFTPLILSYYRKLERMEVDRSINESQIIDPRQVGFAITIGAIISIVLFNFPFSFTSSFVLIMIAIPLLMYIAVRFQTMAFLILLTMIGESAIIHAYMFHRSFVPSHPLEYGPLFTAKLIYVIFAGSLIIISVLISSLAEQNNRVYRSRDEFADNFVNSRLGMFHTTPDGTIERENLTLANLLKYEGMDAINSALERDPNCLFYSKEDLASFMRLVENAHGWADAPLTLRDRLGNPIEVEVAGRPWREANQRAFIEVIVTDLSTVLLLNQKLSASEERIRLATEAGGVGIWEMDLKNKQLFLNAVMERWFGKPTGNLETDLHDLRGLVDPAMYITMDKIIADIAGDIVDSFEIEIRAHVRSVGWRMINFSGKRVFDIDGEPQNRWIGTAWDSNDEYEQRVRLSQANEKLRAESEDNRKLRDAIYNNSIRDLVTGLYTRNYLRKLHEEQVQLTVTTGQPHTLIMIEIRDATTFMKSAGYSNAQKLIVILSDITRHNFRITDHIGRLNVFMVGVLTDLIDEDELRNRMNKIVSQFDTAVLSEMNQTMMLRTSLAIFPTHGNDWETLVTWAEKELI